MIQITDERLAELVATDKTSQELYAIASLKCGWSSEQFLTELVVALANDKRLMTEHAVFLFRHYNGLPQPSAKKPEYVI